ncbi:MAG: hypothetical protein HOP18_28275 [Deltaproteobacteria bacterium]|nr:hypothetical protein [Deltaproteobacteria bacterium]
MYSPSALARLLVLMVATILALHSPTQATSVTEVTFPELVHGADVIAVGSVSTIEEKWDETRQAPLTLVTFSNHTVLKGNPGATMTLEFLGGRTPQGLTLVIPGVPQFKVGEKTVVFCAGNHRDFSPVVGVWQGVLRVMTDPQQGVETVSDNFRIPIVNIQAGKLLKLSPMTAAQAPLTLSALLQAIQQELPNAQ